MTTDLTRRELLCISATGVVSAAAGVPKTADAAMKGAVPKDAVGMLYDTTKCIGCNSCTVACASANDLDPDPGASDGKWQMPTELNSRTKSIIKLYKDEATPSYSFVKQQCMHCIDPACVAGCPFLALNKGAKGVVEWDPIRCIGCRYCEVACPFGVPAFEWFKFNPRIVKCQLCDHLVGKTQDQPACTNVCPTGAVIYGTREELLKEAKARVLKNPGKYFENRVYGEKEAGGLQVFYLSHVPFEKIGLPKLKEESVPAYAQKYQSKIYLYLAIPAIVFGVIAKFVKKNWAEHEAHANSSGESNLEDL